VDSTEVERDSLSEKGHIFESAEAWLDTMRFENFPGVTARFVSIIVALIQSVYSLAHTRGLIRANRTIYPSDTAGAPGTTSARYLVH
jgi:hypothetical protein